MREFIQIFEELARPEQLANMERIIDNINNNIDWGGGDGELVVEEFAEWARMDIEEVQNLDLKTDPDFQTFFKNWASNQIANAWWRFKHLAEADGSFHCWRMITAPATWKPTDQHLGVYWSWEKDAAAAHWGQYREGMHEWLIEAIIPYDSINWEWTLAQNATPSYEEEKEIAINQNAPVELISAKMVKRGAHESVEIDEVERGGSIELGDFIDGLADKDMSSDQLDLFQNVPSGEPRLPPNYKLVGKQGEFHIAKKLDAGKGKTAFVWIFQGEAAAYICLVPWAREHMNYPGHAIYAPDLHGKGMRVAAVFVRDEYRGKKLGLAMYRWCLESVVDYLIADEMHTSGGEQLWRLMRRTRPFHVEVWDGDKYLSRKRKSGKDFDQVYNVNHLIPWVTLDSKYSKVMNDSEED